MEMCHSPRMHHHPSHSGIWKRAVVTDKPRTATLKDEEKNKIIGLFRIRTITKGFIMLSSSMVELHTIIAYRHKLIYI